MMLRAMLLRQKRMSLRLWPAAERHFLGASRQIALDVVHALPEGAVLEDILITVATRRWPEDPTD